jgi:hypothetical protein
MLRTRGLQFASIAGAVSDPRSSYCNPEGMRKSAFDEVNGQIIAWLGPAKT